MKRYAFLWVLCLIVALVLIGTGCGGGENTGGTGTPTTEPAGTSASTQTPASAQTPVSTPAPTTATSTSNTMIQRGVALYNNGAHITFPVAFNSTPVVVASAQLNYSAKSACAFNISSTGFDMGLTNLWGAVETRDYWVQWIAVGQGTVDTSLAIVTNYVNVFNWTDAGFKKPFSSEPVVIVASAQNSGIPKVAGTVDVTSTGFELVLGGHKGSGGTGVQAWTSLIAVGPGTYDPNVMVQSGSGTYTHDTHIAFPETFAGTPVVVVSAQSDGTPKIASALNATATGFTVLVIDHNGSGVSNASVQWIAVGSAS